MIEPSQKPTSRFNNIKNVLNLDTSIENKYKLLKLINNDLILENFIEILK